MSFSNPFGCGPGTPCRDILNQINTYDNPKYYPTAESYLSCFPVQQVPCSAITHCISGGTGGSVTPILISSNSMYISNPAQNSKYIGNKTAGFSGSEWNITASGVINVGAQNCGVPLPHSINGSVSDAINVCGNLYMVDNRTTSTVVITVSVFECSESIDATLVDLGSITLSCESGTNECWSIDVDSGSGALTECTTHLLISIQVTSDATPTIIKSSYKATIENVA